MSESSVRDPIRIALADQSRNWHVTDGTQITGDLKIECDVVIVGSGADNVLESTRGSDYEDGGAGHLDEIQGAPITQGQVFDGFGFHQLSNVRRTGF